MLCRYKDVVLHSVFNGSLAVGESLQIPVKVRTLFQNKLELDHERPRLALRMHGGVKLHTLLWHNTWIRWGKCKCSLAGKHTCLQCA